MNHLSGSIDRPGRHEHEIARLDGAAWLYAILGLVLVFCLDASVHAQQRDRPTIDSSLGYRIILSDQGTLLRGVSLAWDGGDPFGSLAKSIPTDDQLRRLTTEFGLNTVHLYLEGNSSGNPNPAGSNLVDADAFVEATADAGLYLIVTIGCNGENGSIHDLQFAKDFWSIYADRYRDQTHVVFEVHNEPVAYTPNQWTLADWNAQIELYQTIRTFAPDSLVLLGSFMGFAGDPSFGATYLASNGVSWENAGFAHHGYEGKSGIENAIAIMQSSPDFPALLNTEFWPGDTEGQGYNSMYESRLNGWMQFQWLGADDEDLDLFRSKITTAGTIWTPDDATATWPAVGSPSLPKDGDWIGLYHRGARRFVRAGSAPGDSLRVDRTIYSGGSEGDAFRVEYVSPRRCRLRAISGGHVRTIGETDALDTSGNAKNATVFEMIQVPNGDVVLRAFDSGGHLVRLEQSTQRLLPDADDGRAVNSRFAIVSVAGDTPEPVVGDPFFGVPHEIPGRIEAEDYDLGGPGVSYNDEDASNNGGRYRPLEGVDIERVEDIGGGFNIGWIGPGEWIDYAVFVRGTQPLSLDLDVRVASPASGASFGVSFAGVDPAGSIDVPSTGGYQTWTTVSRPVVLQPGPQIMRFFNRGSASFNLNWFELIYRPCPADLNGDGRVDGADLPFVLGAWGGCDGGCTADIDGDGAVDGGDLSAVLGAWGVCP